jgi:hypothetical protein
VTVPLLAPGLATTRHHPPRAAAPGFPTEDASSTEPCLRLVPELLRRLRTELSFEFHLLHDELGHRRDRPPSTAAPGSSTFSGV